MTDRERIAERLAGSHAKFMHPHDLALIESLIRDAAERAWNAGYCNGDQSREDAINRPTMRKAVQACGKLPADFLLVLDAERGQAQGLTT
jgi:hypothetical protein